MSYNPSHQTIAFSFISTPPAFIYPEFHALLHLCPNISTHHSGIKDFLHSTEGLDVMQAKKARESGEMQTHTYNDASDMHDPGTAHWTQSQSLAGSQRLNYQDTRFVKDEDAPEPHKFAFLSYQTQHEALIHRDLNDIYLKRAVLLDSAYQVYLSYSDVKYDLGHRLRDVWMRGMKFRLDVVSTHKKLSLDEVLVLRAKYIDWIFEGVEEVAREGNVTGYTPPEVSIKEPEVVFTLNMNYDKTGTELLGEYFGRRLGDSSRKPLLARYALNKRDYIGTTSMTALLSFLCANQAQVQDGQLVLDPFVGTGSLLVACAHLGCYVMGTDLDYKTLHGRNNKNLHSNFKQYGLDKQVMFDVFRACLSQQRSLWRASEIFDAIVTDPPYGKRESASKIGRRKKVDVILEDHIPSRVQYDRDELMDDFLNLCAMLLKVGGRLVYWLVSDVVFRIETDLPTHPCFKLICISEERLSKKGSRRLITMQKVQAYEAGMRDMTGLEKRIREADEDTRERKKVKIDEDAKE